jgi:hypothetical protein
VGSFSTGYAKALYEQSAYEGAVQQDCEKLLSLAQAAADRPSIFKRLCLGLICDLMKGYG